MGAKKQHTENSPQQLILLTGLSGSGKTVALHALEDLDYYCVDNLPSGMLQSFLRQILEHPQRYPAVAVAIDARDRSQDMSSVPNWLGQLKSKGIDNQILFLSAENKILLQRFSETRRRHPLTQMDITLPIALELEREILQPLAEAASYTIDTSDINLHQLRRQIAKLVKRDSHTQMTLVLESFAFKHGVPQDIDFLFDARCLPNPHWKPELRRHTGQDQVVKAWLDSEPVVVEYLADTWRFLNRWLSEFADSQRSYITIGIGCTGGQHRSVYLVEKLECLLVEHYPLIQKVHRELE